MVVKTGGVNAAKKLEDAEKKKERDLQAMAENSKFHKDIVTQNHLSAIVNITKDEPLKKQEFKPPKASMP